MGVSEEIRRAIEELGFEHPMPVQEEVIPFLLGNGNDVIALAQTGTGKTAAFGIPLLQRTDPTDRTTQAIVISPTRELCLQIADDLKSFSKYIKGINIVAVYGGTSIVDQMRALKHGAQIIVERGDGKSFTYRVVENRSMGLEEVNKTGMQMMMKSSLPCNASAKSSSRLWISNSYWPVRQSSQKHFISMRVSMSICRILFAFMMLLREIKPIFS